MKRGDTITYWVSSGKPQVTVPDLSRHDRQTDAQAALAAAGLMLGTVSTQTSDTVPAGARHQPGPAGRHQGRQGHAVNIVVSSGTPTPSPTPTPTVGDLGAITCPTCTAWTRHGHEHQLSAPGSVVRQGEDQHRQPAGTVVKVSPDTGTVAPDGLDRAHDRE